MRDQVRSEGARSIARAAGFYDRLAVGALLFVPVTLGVIGLLMLATYGPVPGEMLAPLWASAIVNVGLAAVAFLVRGVRLLRGLFVAVVGFVAFVSTMLTLILGSIGHPDSFFDFVPSITVVVGPAVAFVALILAHGRRSKGMIEPGTRRQHILAATLVGAFVLVAAMSGVGTIAFRTRMHIPRNARIVYTQKNMFQPAVVRATEGQVVTLAFVNRDPYSHNFNPDSSELLTDDYIGPKAVKVIRFRAKLPPPPGPGEQNAKTRNYDAFSCTVSGHGDMKGKIFIDVN